MSLFVASRWEATQRLHNITREELILILSREDRNGIYSDDQHTKEFGQPATLQELKESFWRLWDGPEDTAATVNNPVSVKVRPFEVSWHNSTEARSPYDAAENASQMICQGEAVEFVVKDDATGDTYNVDLSDVRTQVVKNEKPVQGERRVCSACGSTKVAKVKLVNPDTGEVYQDADALSVGFEDSDHWCLTCFSKTIIITQDQYQILDSSDSNPLEKGDSVMVPDPDETKDDAWEHEFVGEIKEFSFGPHELYAVVIDGDGDAFSVEANRLTFIPF